MDAFDAADFAVGQILESYSDAGRTTFASGHEGQRYEISALDASAETLTIRQLDDPAGKGLIADLADNSFVTKYWRFFDLFDGEPGTSDHATARGISDDELHIVVYDSTGAQTGFDNDVAGERTNSVLETYAFLSKNPSPAHFWKLSNVSSNKNQGPIENLDPSTKAQHTCKETDAHKFNCQECFVLSLSFLP